MVKSSNHQCNIHIRTVKKCVNTGRYYQGRVEYSCGTIDFEAAQSPPATNQGWCCLPEHAYRSYNEPQHAPAPSRRPKGRPRAASAHGRCAWQSRESAANAVIMWAPRPQLRAGAARRARIQHALHVLQVWTLACDVQGSTGDPFVRPQRARARERVRESACVRPPLSSSPLRIEVAPSAVALP